MSLFNISWRTQVTNLLPSFKRGSSLIDFITSLLEPLKTKASEYFGFDVEIRKRANFNSQIIILRAALNDIFGITVAPLIDIETIEGIGEGVFFYNSTEGVNPTYFYNTAEGITTPFFNASEIGDGSNFTVKIPVGIYTAELETQVRAEVTTYKLSGKTFNITTY